MSIVIRGNQPKKKTPAARRAAREEKGTDLGQTAVGSS